MPHSKEKTAKMAGEFESASGTERYFWVRGGKRGNQKIRGGLQ